MYDTEARRLVDSILGYFALMERAASLRNNRLAVQHFQECWLVVCERFYGSALTPLYRAATPCAPLPVLTFSLRQRWFKDKYSRPLRRVVGRIARHDSSGLGAGARDIEYDVLECGHQVVSHAAEFGERPARHRRCGECPRKGSHVGGNSLTPGARVLKAAA